MLRSQNGITLVALVVTIIILVILATISISIALNSGIIDRASTAAEIYSNAEKEEIGVLANAVYDIDVRLNSMAPAATI